MKVPRYFDQPIADIKALSERLEVPVSELQFLAANADAFYRANKPVIKPNGAIRQTYRVMSRLQLVQEQIKLCIFYAVCYPDYLRGSLKDPDDPRNPVTSATPHVGKRFILKEDIANFFPSIKRAVVMKMWQGLFGFPTPIAELLTALTTLQGFVPQGAKTSSYIANLIFWDKEPQLEKALRERGYTYSRYVDDITVSSQQQINKDEQYLVTSMVYKMLFQAGVKPKRNKRRVETSGKRMTVQNLNVNSSKPTLDKKERSRIRAAVKECEIHAQTDRASLDYVKLFQIVYGRVAWLKELHPKLAEQYKQRLDAIRPLGSASYRVQELPEKSIVEQPARYEHLLADLGAPSLEATKAFLAEREIAEPEEGLTEALRARIEAKIAAATQPQ